MIDNSLEVAGLGKAPFVLMDITDEGWRRFKCDYCGTAIRYRYSVKSADNKCFVVGSTCVEKTGNTNLVTEYEEKQKADARQIINKAVIAMRNVELCDELAKIPHPNRWRATTKGETYLDYINWVLGPECWSRAARLKVSGYIEKFIASNAIAVA